MPVEDVRLQRGDEYDLDAEDLPAVSSGVVHGLTDLARQGSPIEYVSCTVINDSAALVRIRDGIGRRYPIRSGQTADLDFFPGVPWLGVVPAADIGANQVTVIPRVRRLDGKR